MIDIDALLRRIAKNDALLLPTAASVTLMITLLEDSSADAEDRAFAAESLGLGAAAATLDDETLLGDVVASLRVTADDHSAEVREAAVRALAEVARRRDDQLDAAIDVLAPKTADRNAQVSAAAVQSIARLPWRFAASAGTVRAVLLFQLEAGPAEARAWSQVALEQAWQKGAETPKGSAEHITVTDGKRSPPDRPIRRAVNRAASYVRSMLLPSGQYRLRVPSAAYLSATRDETETVFTPISPVSTYVLSRDPSFEWNRVPDAVEYVLEVREEDGKLLWSASMPADNGQERVMWRYSSRDKPLEPGRTYRWEVRAVSAGRSTVSRPEALFSVAGERSRERVAGARADATLNLSKVVRIYVEEGLFQDAEDLLATFPDGERGSRRARSAIARLRRFRGLPEDDMERILVPRITMSTTRG